MNIEEIVTGLYFVLAKRRDPWHGQLSQITGPRWLLIRGKHLTFLNKVGLQAGANVAAAEGFAGSESPSKSSASPIAPHSGAVASARPRSSKNKTPHPPREDVAMNFCAPA